VIYPATGGFLEILSELSVSITANKTAVTGKVYGREGQQYQVFVSLVILTKRRH
jgi:hypothetical protein